MSVVHVATEFPLSVEDVDGSWHRIEGAVGGVFVGIPASAYRRNAWMGLFHRRLVRVRGYGREFWIDDVWREQEAFRQVLAGADAGRPAWVPVAPPGARQSGCGCGGQKTTAPPA